MASSTEAQERARGYRDACAFMNVPDVRFHQADWQIEEGVATAHMLLRNLNDLPDVAFCCNDDLAVGLQETLQENGVRIPEDIMISGFDNRKISLRTSPRITTIDRDYFSIGQTAMRTLEQAMAGEEPPLRVSSPVRYIFSASCDYATTYDEKMMSDIYTLDNSLKQFYELLNQFQSSVLNAESLEHILRDCERYAPYIRLDRFGELAYDHMLRDFDEAYFIFVDIDNMKLINDVCGHEMGDCAIRDMADIIRRATIGENAFAMRYGGDEFPLICRRNLMPKLEAELALLKKTRSTLTT